MFEIKKKEKWVIDVQASFDSAHWLIETNTPCDAIHGHRWTVHAYIYSYKLNKDGMVINFSVVKKWLNKIVDEFDHNIINRYLDQPTAENITMYIFNKIRKKLYNYPNVYIDSIKIYETPNNSCVYSCEYDYDMCIEEKNKKISNMRKEEWKDETKREERIKKMKKAFNRDEERKRRSQHMIENNPMKNRMIVEKMLKSLQKTLHKKPNKHEKLLIDIFKKNNIPLTYIGDGTKIIDGKVPDFINEEQKIIVEYNCDFWHSNNNPWYDTKDDSKERALFFKERGYKCIFIRSIDYEKGEKHIINLLKVNGLKMRTKMEAR